MLVHHVKVQRAQLSKILKLFKQKKHSGFYLKVHELVGFPETFSVRVYKSV